MPLVTPSRAVPLPCPLSASPLLPLRPHPFAREGERHPERVPQRPSPEPCPPCAPTLLRLHAPRHPRSVFPPSCTSAPPMPCRLAAAIGSCIPRPPSRWPLLALASDASADVPPPAAAPLCCPASPALSCSSLAGLLLGKRPWGIPRAPRWPPALRHRSRPPRDCAAKVQRLQGGGSPAGLSWWRQRRGRGPPGRCCSTGNSGVMQLTRKECLCLTFAR